MSHFSGNTRFAIIMERESDDKTLVIKARRHTCTPAAISYILPHQNERRKVSCGTSTDHVMSLDGDKMKKLNKVIKKKPNAVTHVEKFSVENQLKNDYNRLNSDLWSSKIMRF
ncbi:unnamed protein product [Rotaria magnacalcarata]|uniref:Uncharacterized protein n=1 Tax=Rotaria magnacalcarata TaxID=392030 RepID=A0A816HEN7_9BILA|nr:unnamed protein product [Rotaria magnacalcarata]CAF1684732.1 unnamed protein product [Rotaria magnacalcarata]CAF3857599.1 unnamed protein product [Rotaria magnacalcarata]CAF3874905.1 unnamed protein product [Rotaria magnacalcarata]